MKKTASVVSWDFDMQVAIYICDDPQQGDSFHLMGFDKDENRFVYREHKVGTKTTPTLVFNHAEARVLFEGLDSYYRKLGQPPEADAKREGRLEATEKHLEDMRSLAGLND